MEECQSKKQTKKTQQNHKTTKQNKQGKKTNKQKELTKGTTLPDPSVSVRYMLSAFLHRK